MEPADVAHVRHGLACVCELLPKLAHFVETLTNISAGGEADLVDLAASELHGKRGFWFVMFLQASEVRC